MTRYPVKGLTVPAGTRDEFGWYHDSFVPFCENGLGIVLFIPTEPFLKRNNLLSRGRINSSYLLFPKGLAVEANAQSLTELKNREQSAKYKIETEIAAAKKSAAELEGKTIVLTAKAGANGKLFGSVTSKEIAEKVKAQFGIETDKRKVVVEDIKQFGTYEFEIKLYQGISAKLFVRVGE